MARAQDPIMELVERELRKNPKARTTELFEKAKAVDSGVGELSIRQFHARYPLQVKRRQGAKKPATASPRGKSAGTGRSPRKPTAKAPEPPTGNREAVREVFLRFAQDMAAADERRALVKVLGNLDSYVDSAVRAARG